MLSTIVLVVVYSGFLTVSFVLWAVFLRLGLRWARIEGITTRRVIYITALIFVVQLPLGIFSSLPAWSTTPQIVFAVLGFAAVVVLPGLLMAYVFKSRLLRSFQAWLPTLASPVVMIVVALLVVQPFLSQMFSAPSNAMAPTLLGDHWRGTCPECGRPSFASPLPPGTYRPSIGRQPMICENFHLSRGTVAPRVLAGDRFLVAKYLKPRRWDLVVFRSPRDPSTLNVKRLVGLPGEKIQIKDDAVWADGKKLTPPDSIRGIRYLSEFPMHPIVRGSADHPVTLAADEYFVLGDFSANSEDSRFWTQGAPGHQPFAVPHSHVCGVVTHICWPPQRWRILR